MLINIYFEGLKIATDNLTGTYKGKIKTILEALVIKFMGAKSYLAPNL